MAIKPYKKQLELYWKGVDFNKLVYFYINDINIGKSKRSVYRKELAYTLCESRLCPHRLNVCPMMVNSELCKCPNGKITTIMEPRKDTKMYKDFQLLLQQLKYVQISKDYSDFIWHNRDREINSTDYEVLKTIPEFGLKKISQSELSLKEILEVVEKEKDYSKLYQLTWSLPLECSFMQSLRDHYKKEINDFIKMINMEVFLDANTIKLKKFKEKVGDLFEFCGEYVVINIPHLCLFEKWGMSDIFMFPDNKEYYYSRRSNAVRIEDFSGIYHYLMNLVPNNYNWESYQTLYVPIIKEQFPVFCKKHNIKFLEDAV